jgi:hypothetical protein
MRIRHQNLYGIMPFGARSHRAATVAEVLHFETCNAAGPYSAVNCQVPPWVPLWQYVDPQERATAARKSAK